VDSLKALYWNQGLFLKPQHFQHLGLHTLASANAYSTVKTGVKSGLSNLVINQDALKNGMFIIDSLQCVLSDGTLLVYPGNCRIEPIRLDPDLANSEGHIDISVGVATIVSDQTNLSDGHGNCARFALNDEISKADLFDPQESTQLTTVNINCQLLLGDQVKQKDQLLFEKIAEVVILGTDIYQDDKFIPKSLTIQSSAVLQNYIKSLKQGLIARFEQLESFSSMNSGQGNDIAGANLATVMSINVLAEFIPVFSHFEEIQHLPPHQVYLAIRQLIAQLSVFSKTVSVTGELADGDKSLLPYSESNLTECFSRALILSNQLLDELTVDPEFIVEFTAQGESKYVAALSHEFLDPNNLLYLRMRTQQNIEKNSESILQYTKVGADGQVDIYLKRALPGVKLTYLPRKPMGVASSPNSFYFSFDRKSFEWQKIIESGRIGLIWNGSPDDLTVDLIAVKG